MSGFELPENFVEDPESLLRRARANLTPTRRDSRANSSDIPAPSEVMAGKTLRDYSAPSADNVPTGPAVNVGDANFELKTGLINMVQSSPFCGKANEDASAHLQQFLEICNTIIIKGVTPEAIRLRLFPFSLLGKAKQWFYANREAVDTWKKCSAAFLAKFFPLGKTNALRGRISSFQQARDESISDAWERLQEYILACPHHGMDKWLIIQNFYNGLTPSSRNHVDAAAGGAFFSLTVQAATQLIEKIVSNQGWSDERLEKGHRGLHTVKATDMLAAKMDLILKQLGASVQDRAETLQAMDSCMTCEVCGETGHSGNDCPETREDANFINNNGYRPQGQGWNQNRPFYPGNNGNFNNSNSASPFKDFAMGQAKINDSVSKKLAANDKVLESINARLEVVSSSLQNQLSFNKMLETQLAQLAAALPINESGKIPGQPESSTEAVNAVMAVLDIPAPAWQYPNHAGIVEEDYSSGFTSVVHPDPGCPVISCCVKDRIFFKGALCDLGASVSIMPKAVFQDLDLPLAPAYMSIQLADSSVRLPEGIARRVPLEIDGTIVPVDFVVLDMPVNPRMPLILGRPFLKATAATIDVRNELISLKVNGQRLHYYFEPRAERPVDRVDYGSASRDHWTTRSDSHFDYPRQNLALSEEKGMPWKVVKPRRGRKRQEKAKAPVSTVAVTGGPTALPAVPTSPKTPKKVWRAKSDKASTSSSPGTEEN